MNTNGRANSTRQGATLLIARNGKIAYIMSLLQNLRARRLNRKALGAIPVDARRGAHASLGGALRRPYGLAPVIIRHV